MRPDGVAASAGPDPANPGATQPSAALRRPRTYPPVVPAPEWLVALEGEYWAGIERLIAGARSTTES